MSRGAMYQMGGPSWRCRQRAAASSGFMIERRRRAVRKMRAQKKP